jgi:hypothetical protein
MRSWSRVGWQPIDEWDGGFGWLTEERVGRASHALAVDGGVWLTDPVDEPGLDERLRALGEPAGVLQLLDRHNRDCGAVAARLRVPHVRAYASAGGAPFTVVPVRDNRLWREVALWEPHTATLVCADAFGTLPFFLAPGERLGWHPLVRPFPPRRGFAGLVPRRILVGHGAGIFDDAAGALADAVAHGRRRLPRAYAAALRAVRTSGRAASR